MRLPCTVMKFYYLSETILSTVQIYIIFLIQVTVLPDFLINRFFVPTCPEDRIG